MELLALLGGVASPFAAISIGAISSRMTDERQKELVSLLRSEARLIEKAMDEGTLHGALKLRPTAAVP